VILLTLLEPVHVHRPVPHAQAGAHVHPPLPHPESVGARAPLSQSNRMRGDAMGGEDIEVEVCIDPMTSTDRDKMMEDQALIDAALRADWGTTSSTTRRSAW
jgi:hypothetical protein